MKFVDKREDGCWHWTGNKNEWGYGTFKFQDKSWKAHRLIYWHCYGELTPSLEICHTCKNKCVNPEHLEEGTHSKNSGPDKVRDGIDNRGERCGMSKLTSEQVKEIRSRSTESHSHLAKEFGVGVRNIKYIINRNRWTHI